MNFILYSFRRYHQFTREDIAQKLQLSLSEYNAFESENSQIDRKLAAKLSAVYMAPWYVFLIEQNTASLQVIFNHNHFENSNGYVQHLHTATTGNDLINQQNRLIVLLQAELESLRSICKNLIERIDANEK